MKNNSLRLSYFFFKKNIVFLNGICIFETDGKNELYSCDLSGKTNVSIAAMGFE